MAAGLVQYVQGRSRSMSGITVCRFLRLRGPSGVRIRRNLCIREGVRIRTRCVYVLPLA
jgi:hypothetical protein